MSIGPKDLERLSNQRLKEITPDDLLPAGDPTGAWRQINIDEERRKRMPLQYNAGKILARTIVDAGISLLTTGIGTEMFLWLNNGHMLVNPLPFIEANPMTVSTVGIGTFGTIEGVRFIDWRAALRIRRKSIQKRSLI